MKRREVNRKEEKLTKGNVMSIRNAEGIYQVLQRHLQDSPTPLTCVQLYDFKDVRKYAESANRVSDYLGHMWRRKIVKRVATPRTENDKSWFAYSWKSAKIEAPKARVTAPRLQVNGVDIKHHTRLKKAKIDIKHDGDGGVIINFDRFTVHVKQRA